MRDRCKRNVEGWISCVYRLVSGWVVGVEGWSKWLEGGLKERFWGGPGFLVVYW